MAAKVRIIFCLYNRATVPNPAATILYFYGEKKTFLSRIILS
ncbi:hypothetical protein PRABACTJOHN_02216 [Parabacteroides johnsonii DSM 18315]|uniref:Uncharacterized protein n=1 Tax=Parabacteroides johnsonii DSM 18315 TaxID=537006 RepID=B7BB07_9BACT|nr:hypothetical protein PRABACTJOHN_02216 [Parabacteroides johnsonii DSM 18315]